MLTNESVSTPALNLSQVCNVWRNVMFSRPSFWTHFSINLIHSPKMGRVLQPYEAHYKLTDTPMDLTIIADPGLEEGQEVGGVQPWGWGMWNSLVEQSHRWRKVTFSGNWRTFFCTLLDFTDSAALPFGGFPKLEELRLEWEPMSLEQQGIPAPFFHLFSNSPRLRILSVPEYQYWYPFPFGQLTTIDVLDGWSHRQVIHFLQHSPLIRTICLDAWQGYDYVDNDMTVYQSALTSVALLQRDGNECLALINCLRLPDLVSLHVHVDSSIDDEPGDWEKGISDLILRSACPLKHLTLDGGSLVSETDLISLCRLLPTLTHLSIQVEGNRCTFTDAFFTELTIVSGASIGSSSMPLPQCKESILPQLSYLVIRMEAGYPQLRGPLPSVEAILTMAQSRCPIPPGMSDYLLPASTARSESAPLQTFHFGLSAHHPPSDHDERSLSALRELHAEIPLLGDDWYVDYRGSIYNPVSAERYWDGHPGGKV
ncbi:hypothetical protein BT96DRAFT_1065660 [Gymnopus androsaceus JB14]|uniref:F-box domain-containing protein n=1 Tax=Gymnopus androsaceus JB14 TaxID=1447944 RepID=A0A6A4I3R8_9AGAR|nr:hypothetical protein BT96DRAFT_1065660 [Gymnopus androsaceus JB14]